MKLLSLLVIAALATLEGARGGRVFSVDQRTGELALNGGEIAPADPPTHGELMRAALAAEAARPKRKSTLQSLLREGEMEPPLGLCPPRGVSKDALMLVLTQPMETHRIECLAEIRDRCRKHNVTFDARSEPLAALFPRALQQRLPVLAFRVLHCSNDRRLVAAASAESRLLTGEGAELARWGVHRSHLLGDESPELLAAYLAKSPLHAAHPRWAAVFPKRFHLGDPKLPLDYWGRWGAHYATSVASLNAWLDYLVRVERPVADHKARRRAVLQREAPALLRHFACSDAPLALTLELLASLRSADPQQLAKFLVDFGESMLTCAITSNSLARYRVFSALIKAAVPAPPSPAVSLRRLRLAARHADAAFLEHLLEHPAREMLHRGSRDAVARDEPQLQLGVRELESAVDSAGSEANLELLVGVARLVGSSVRGPTSLAAFASGRAGERESVRVAEEHWARLGPAAVLETLAAAVSARNDALVHFAAARVDVAGLAATQAAGLLRLLPSPLAESLHAALSPAQRLAAAAMLPPLSEALPALLRADDAAKLRLLYPEVFALDGGSPAVEKLLIAAVDARADAVFAALWTPLYHAPRPGGEIEAAYKWTSAMVRISRGGTVHMARCVLDVLRDDQLFALGQAFWMQLAVNVIAENAEEVELFAVVAHRLIDYNDAEIWEELMRLAIAETSGRCRGCDRLPQARLIREILRHASPESFWAADLPLAAGSEVAFAELYRHLQRPPLATAELLGVLSVAIHEEQTGVFDAMVTKVDQRDMGSAKLRLMRDALRHGRLQFAARLFETFAYFHAELQGVLLETLGKEDALLPCCELCAIDGCGAEECWRAESVTVDAKAVVNFFLESPQLRSVVDARKLLALDSVLRSNALVERLIDEAVPLQSAAASTTATAGSASSVGPASSGSGSSGAGSRSNSGSSSSSMGVNVHGASFPPSVSAQTFLSMHPLSRTEMEAAWFRFVRLAVKELRPADLAARFYDASYEAMRDVEIVYNRITTAKMLRLQHRPEKQRKLVAVAGPAASVVQYGRGRQQQMTFAVQAIQDLQLVLRQRRWLGRRTSSLGRRLATLHTLIGLSGMGKSADERRDFLLTRLYEPGVASWGNLLVGMHVLGVFEPAKEGRGSRSAAALRLTGSSEHRGAVAVLLRDMADFSALADEHESEAGASAAWLGEQLSVQMPHIISANTPVAWPGTTTVTAGLKFWAEQSREWHRLLYLKDISRNEAAMELELKHVTRLALSVPQSHFNSASVRHGRLDTALSETCRAAQRAYLPHLGDAAGARASESPAVVVVALSRLGFRADVFARAFKVWELAKSMGPTTYIAMIEALLENGSAHTATPLEMLLRAMQIRATLKTEQHWSALLEMLDNCVLPRRIAPGVSSRMVDFLRREMIDKTGTLRKYDLRWEGVHIVLSKFSTYIPVPFAQAAWASLELAHNQRFDPDIVRPIVAHLKELCGRTPWRRCFATMAAKHTELEKRWTAYDSTEEDFWRVIFQEE